MLSHWSVRVVILASLILFATAATVSCTIALGWYKCYNGFETFDYGTVNIFEQRPLNLNIDTYCSIIDLDTSYQRTVSIFTQQIEKMKGRIRKMELFDIALETGLRYSHLISV